jgi:hypothetical protein
LDQGVGLLLGAGAPVTGGPVGLQDRFDRGAELLPADGVEVEAAGDGAVVVHGQVQLAALGGVGFGAVLIEPGQVPADHLLELGVRAGGGEPGQHRVDLAQVHAVLGGGGQPGGFGDRGDGIDLFGAERTGGEPGGDRGQRLDHPTGPHDRGGGGIGQPAVPAQPGPHRHQPVPLRGLRQLRATHGAGQLRLGHVPQRHQHGGALQQLRVGQRVQIISREHGEAIARC